MAYSVQDVISQVQPHFAELTPPKIINILNDVNRDLYQSLRLEPGATQDITLVAGTKTYALNSLITRIWSVMYLTSATDGRALTATSLDQLDYTYPNNRIAENSTPYAYYEDGGYIGIFPPPDTATAGSGYPKVTIYCQKEPTSDMTISSTFPEIVRNIDAWVYAICEQYALQTNDPRFPIFAEKAARALNTLRTRIYGRVPRDKPNVFLKIPQIRQY